MASPDELQLEQKARALKLKEDALNRQAQQQQKTDERLKSHQDSVAKKERANQLKAQDLIKRENKLNDDKTLLQRERQALSELQQATAKSSQRPMLIVLPLLLFACIVGGYFAYEQLEKKQQHFSEIAFASANIDKLASILSLTQDEVISQSNALENKKSELDKTKNMLSELKHTSDTLANELVHLKGNEETSASEKAALVSSAEYLKQQLAELKVQLEDKYLTIDIIEALVDYQESNLNNVKGELATKQELLAQQQSSLSEQKTLEASLKQELESKASLLSQQALKTQAAQKELEDVQQQLQAAKRALKEQQRLLAEQKLKAQANSKTAIKDVQP